MKIHTPWSLDADRSRNHYVISDAEGNVAALVPGEENDAEPHNAPEDAEAKARAEAIVAAVNATPVHVPGIAKSFETLSAARAHALEISKKFPTEYVFISECSGWIVTRKAYPSPSAYSNPAPNALEATK